MPLDSGKFLHTSLSSDPFWLSPSHSINKRVLENGCHLWVKGLANFTSLLSPVGDVLFHSAPPSLPPPLLCLLSCGRAQWLCVKMRNPEQRSATPASHAIIKTAKCCRDTEKRGKISPCCQMKAKATYSLMDPCEKNWQYLQGHQTATHLNHGRECVHQCQAQDKL